MVAKRRQSRTGTPRRAGEAPAAQASSSRRNAARRYTGRPARRSGNPVPVLHACHRSSRQLRAGPPGGRRLFPKAASRASRRGRLAPMTLPTTGNRLSGSRARTLPGLRGPCGQRSTDGSRRTPPVPEPSGRSRQMPSRRQGSEEPVRSRYDRCGRSGIHNTAGTRGGGLLLSDGGSWHNEPQVVRYRLRMEATYIAMLLESRLSSTISW